MSALRRLYPRPPPGRPSKVAVLASAGRNNLSRGAAPHSGSLVGKSRPRVQTGFSSRKCRAQTQLRRSPFTIR
ncbi:hypothetical protein MRX96_058773 [Rhipicephalus microplus]